MGELRVLQVKVMVELQELLVSTERCRQAADWRTWRVWRRCLEQEVKQKETLEPLQVEDGVRLQVEWPEDSGKAEATG